MTLKGPRETVVRQLYGLSLNRCAFPDCKAQLVEPTGTIVGEVCHIRAQSPGGPRYSDVQSDEERHGFDNLILMCRNHHKVIDDSANLSTYTVEWLLQIKQDHEYVARQSGEISAPTQVIQALRLTGTVYEAGSTHMDFRDATFKVGGEGGGLGGGGGSGGVLTIVGYSRLPRELSDEISLDLAGEAGKAPGGGGGGSGLLAFQGRPATADDLDEGLVVPLFFPVQSYRLSDGLLDVLGAGWEHYSVVGFPASFEIPVAFMVDCGKLDPEVLIGFDFSLADPSGNEQILSATVDVAVPDRVGLLNRRCQAVVLSATVDGAGVHTLSIRSGGLSFAHYEIDIRLR